MSTPTIYFIPTQEDEKKFNEWRQTQELSQVKEITKALQSPAGQYNKPSIKMTAENVLEIQYHDLPEKTPHKRFLEGTSRKYQINQEIASKIRELSGSLELSNLYVMAPNSAERLGDGAIDKYVFFLNPEKGEYIALQVNGLAPVKKQINENVPAQIANHGGGGSDRVMSLLTPEPKRYRIQHNLARFKADDVLKTFQISSPEQTLLQDNKDLTENTVWKVNEMTFLACLMCSKQLNLDNVNFSSEEREILTALREDDFFIQSLKKENVRPISDKLSKLRAILNANALDAIQYDAMIVYKDQQKKEFADIMDVTGPFRDKFLSDSDEKKWGICSPCSLAELVHVDEMYKLVQKEGETVVSFTGATTNTETIGSKKLYNQDGSLVTFTCQGETFGTALDTLAQTLARELNVTVVQQAAMHGEEGTGTLSGDKKIADAFLKENKHVIGLFDTCTGMLTGFARGWTGNTILFADNKSVEQDNFHNNFKEDLLIGRLVGRDKARGPLLMYGGGPTVSSNYVLALLCEHPVPIIDFAAAHGDDDCTSQFSGGYGLLQKIGAFEVMNTIHNIATRPVYSKGLLEYNRKAACILLLKTLDPNFELVMHQDALKSLSTEKLQNKVKETVRQMSPAGVSFKEKLKHHFKESEHLRKNLAWAENCLINRGLMQDAHRVACCISTTGEIYQNVWLGENPKAIITLPGYSLNETEMEKSTAKGVRKVKQFIEKVCASGKDMRAQASFATATSSTLFPQKEHSNTTIENAFQNVRPLSLKL